jgi:hypothetical protein
MLVSFEQAFLELHSDFELQSALALALPEQSLLSLEHAFFSVLEQLAFALSWQLSLADLSLEQLPQ